MNPLQIKLKLGLDVLGIPLDVENYRLICNAVYLAEKRKVYISPARLEFSKERGYAYSPRTHESGGHPSRSLLDDILEISQDIQAGLDDSDSWQFDKTFQTKLQQLKKDIQIKGLLKLLTEAA